MDEPYEGKISDKSIEWTDHLEVKILVLKEDGPYENKICDESTEWTGPLEGVTSPKVQKS